MENDSFRLIVRRGPRPNEVYELSGDVVNLGRDITNDIVINDREVSRHHLRFTKGADGFTLEDLGSTNGTFVNGKRVSGSIALKNGDMVGLGETVTLQYEAGRPVASAVSPQPESAAPSAPAPQPNAQDAQYRPPQPQVPSQPSPPPQQPVPQADPYRAPEPQPQVQAYQQQPDPAPQYQEADAYAPPQDYYDQQGAAAYGPPPPGYDYDPYAMRDEEGGSTMQWILIGCTGLLLLCCCLTVVAAVAIDSFCLYEQVPILNNILRALAIPVNCPV
ncbi:MAG: FHA domain-containing protein [Chloroflexota bacterium]